MLSDVGAKFDDVSENTRRFVNSSIDSSPTEEPPAFRALKEEDQYKHQMSTIN